MSNEQGGDAAPKAAGSVDDSQAGSFSLGFGLERLGTLALAYPTLMALALVALTAFAAFGINRLKVDDSLSELFRADTAEFRQYEELSTRFPSSEYDVLVVAESPDLLQRPKVEALRELVTELHFVDAMTGLVSMFSARQAPQPGSLPPPLFPDELPDGTAYDALMADVRSNEIIRGKLLSEDGQLALIVMALDRNIVSSQGLKDVIGQIQTTVDEKLAGSGITAKLAGAPVMQLEIRNAVERDQLTYNGLGFLIGAGIAWFFLRRLSLLAMTALPPIFAIIWSLGALGWLDFRLNLFLNVMTPLIMVMAFSDSMQITFAIRDRLASGDTRMMALKNAILQVGPACVLTDGTAALSFITLLFSDSGLIRTFGMAGAISTLISFLAVITIVPIVGVFLMRDDKGAAESIRSTAWAVDGLSSFALAITRMVVRAPLAWSIAGLLIVIGFGALHMSLEPRYRLTDQVPDQEQAIDAAGRLDQKLTGANPVHVLVELPEGKEIYDPQMLEAIGAAHRIVERQAGVGNVWSLETLRIWIEDKLKTRDIEILKGYVSQLPPFLTQRFIAVDGRAVVVTGRIPDIDASKILPMVDGLDKAMQSVRDAYPGVRISVTGLPAIAARNSASMISQLNSSLTIEMVFVAALIGLAFRSVAVAAIAVLPGLFPIVASGALLWAMGEGLQFASIVALTVAFGLGLDATIHYLNRLRLETRSGEDPEAGVLRAARLVGPALMLTTIVLACGLAVTMFSELPSLRLFGELSAVTLMAALVGDLIILPATVLLFRRWFGPRAT